MTKRSRHNDTPKAFERSPTWSSRVVTEMENSLQKRPSSRGATQYLTFSLDAAEYAVSILRIREIFELHGLTPIPSTPRWIRGVMNLRGRVVSVVDLSLKFGLRETPVTNRTCVVIMEVELDGASNVIGVLVDAVNRVVDLTSDQIQPPPAFGAAVRVDCLDGMGKVGDVFVPILNVDRVLSSDELVTAIDAPCLADAASAMRDDAPIRGARARAE